MMKLAKWSAKNDALSNCLNLRARKVPIIALSARSKLTCPLVRRFCAVHLPAKEIAKGVIPPHQKSRDSRAAQPSGASRSKCHVSVACPGGDCHGCDRSDIGTLCLWRRLMSRRAVNVSLRTDLVPLDPYNTGSLNDQGINIRTPKAVLCISHRTGFPGQRNICTCRKAQAKLRAGVARSYRESLGKKAHRS